MFGIRPNGRYCTMFSLIRSARLLFAVVAIVIAAGLMASMTAHAASPCTTVSLTPNPDLNSFSKGTTIHFTATASGCGGTPVYAWWLGTFDSQGQNVTGYKQLAPYSTTNTYDWKTSSLSIGKYYLIVWAENQ